MKGALDGIRVLDFSRLLPGPYCTWLLADQGAEVIRIENPRELAKQEKVFGWDKLSPDEKAAQRARDMLARNKKSLMLDIGAAETRDLLLDLARTADVVVEDYRPGVLASLGLGPADFAAVNPRIVYTSLTLCGQTGPYRDKPGHDPVALALSGVLSRTGEDPDAPGLPGVPNADILTGSHAAFAILAAIRQAERTGHGQHLDVAMAECSMSLLANVLSRYVNPDDAPKRDTRRADMGLWACADGKWLITTDMEPRYWATFCETLGRPDFIPLQLDRSRWPEIRETLAAIFATRPRDEWLAILGAAGTQFAPVQDVSEAITDPHFTERGMVIEVTGPSGEALRQLGPPVRIGGLSEIRTAVSPGHDNDEILNAAGQPRPSAATTGQ